MPPHPVFLVDNIFFYWGNRCLRNKTFVIIQSKEQIIHCKWCSVLAVFFSQCERAHHLHSNDLYPFLTKTFLVRTREYVFHTRIFWPIKSTSEIFMTVGKITSGFRFMVFYATLNSISVISWRSAL